MKSILKTTTLLCMILFIQQFTACQSLKNMNWNPMEIDWSFGLLADKEKAKSKDSLSKNALRDADSTEAKNTHKKTSKQLSIIILKNKAWERCAIGQSEVYCRGKTRTLNWWQASDYCKALNIKNLKWRLPTQKELVDLFQYSQNRRIRHFQISVGDYWTSESYNHSSKASATVNLRTGRPYGELQWKNASVKCISDRQPYKTKKSTTDKKKPETIVQPKSDSAM